MHFKWGVLSKTVYVHQPPVFKHKQFPDHVCELHKALYGLKQAHRVWFDRFSSFLSNKGALHLLLILHSSLSIAMDNSLLSFSMSMTCLSLVAHPHSFLISSLF